MLSLDTVFNSMLRLISCKDADCKLHALRPPMLVDFRGTSKASSRKGHEVRWRGADYTVYGSVVVAPQC